MSHAHQHLPEPPHSDDTEDVVRYQKIRDITLVGALVNIILAILKVICGYLGQSQALVADGLHSLSDLASDVLVLYAAKHGRKGADEEHPYGHARIETLFTVLLGVFLIIVAAGIMIDTTRRMLEPTELLHPGLLALSVGVIAIAAKEVLYQYTMKVANAVRSKLLKANAWHHRSDAISSVIVVIGIGGTMMGVVYLDAIAAIGMALMIIKIGWVLCLQSLQELVDTGLPADRVKLISDTIQGVPGVRELHTLRTRRMGHDALVDVHIQVAPKLSVSEGHFISESVRGALIEEVEEVIDVMVHIDPEDDEVHSPNEELPNRERLIADLNKRWSSIEAAKHIKKINLHYLDGKIHMELLLPLDKFDDTDQARQVAEQLKQITREDKLFAETTVLFV